MSDKYQIAEDSEVKEATVDDKELGGAREPQSLTKDQVKRLEDAGVKLETAKPDNTNTGGQ